MQVLPPPLMCNTTICTCRQLKPSKIPGHTGAGNQSKILSNAHPLQVWVQEETSLRVCILENEPVCLSLPTKCGTSHKLANQGQYWSCDHRY